MNFVKAIFTCVDTKGGDFLNKRVHIYLPEDVLETVDNLSSELGLNRSSLIEKACKQYVEHETKSSLIDSIVGDMSKALDAALDPKIERLAKMVSKGVIFSGVSQNLLIQHLEESSNEDILEIYRNAKLKAVEDFRRPLDTLIGVGVKE